MPGATDRYLSAATLYEKSGLYKNAIAVCKKMMRLSLAPAQVLERLAGLHALDGLGSEAALYYQQFAEHLVREQQGAQAAAALHKAYDADPDETRLLEFASEAHVLAGETDAAAAALAHAAYQYRKRGSPESAARCREGAERLEPGAWREFLAQHAPGEMEDDPGRPAEVEPAPDDDRSADPEPGSPGEEWEAEPAAESWPTELPAFAPGSDPEPAMRTAAEATAQPVAGLDFDPPALRADEPAAPEPASTPPLGAQEIEELLQRAQVSLRDSDAEGAARTLVEAARAYEVLGRFDSAATIYRSVVRSAASPREVLDLWLANAERRDARQEAADVACQIGDHALEAGDRDGARAWFLRAVRLDENSSHAQRRLQRLDPTPQPKAGPPIQMAVETAPLRAAATDPGSHEPASLVGDAMAASPAAGAGSAPADRVELALGRGEAVSFDLGSVLAEFHRGIEAQLSGDAQGHYDLAMAYREMGLLDHAVESFRMALSSPALASRATEMLGRSLLDQGRFDDAVQELSSLLGRTELDGEARLGLRYLLGLAFEAAGRSQEALAEFETVFEQQASFQDVAQKLRDLRRTLGSA